MIFYILYRIGYFLANVLPLKLAYSLSKRVSDIQWLVSKKDREAVALNLSIITKKDSEECSKLTRKVFRNFGLYLVDFFRMASLTKDDIKKRVRVEGKGTARPAGMLLGRALRKNHQGFSLKSKCRARLAVSLACWSQRDIYDGPIAQPGRAGDS